MKMFETRRKDRLLDDDECKRILRSGSYGVLSTINENGYPYGVPLSYVYFNDFIYIHGSKE